MDHVFHVTKLLISEHCHHQLLDVSLYQVTINQLPILLEDYLLQEAYHLFRGALSTVLSVLPFKIVLFALSTISRDLIDIVIQLVNFDILLTLSQELVLDVLMTVFHVKLMGNASLAILLLILEPLVKLQKDVYRFLDTTNHFFRSVLNVQLDAAIVQV